MGGPCPELADGLREFEALRDRWHSEQRYEEHKLLEQGASLAGAAAWQEKVDAVAARYRGREAEAWTRSGFDHSLRLGSEGGDGTSGMDYRPPDRALEPPPPLPTLHALARATIPSSTPPAASVAALVHHPTHLPTAR